jgi:hypothetical protein
MSEQFPVLVVPVVQQAPVALPAVEAAPVRFLPSAPLVLMDPKLPLWASSVRLVAVAVEPHSCHRVVSKVQVETVAVAEALTELQSSVKSEKLAPVVVAVVASQTGLLEVRVAPERLSFDTWQVKLVLLRF